MSRLYEALRKSEREHQQKGATAVEMPRTAETMANLAASPLELESTRPIQAHVSADSHLVALTEPQGLAAEKFRVLVTRLDNLRGQKELKSLQVTSSVMNEGKTLVATNLALTLARHSQSRVLLLEGDLHKPGIQPLLGQNHLPGLAQWWQEKEAPLSNYLYRINDSSLWFLPAGGASREPAEILQTNRFAEAFGQLTGLFDWIIVDSTPLLPMADANMWNRMVDGTLLVVREGVTPVKTLKKGLASLDNPKLVGIVLNGASEFDRVNYYESYYTGPNNSKNGHQKKKAAERSS